MLKFCLVRVIVVSQEHREAKDHKVTKYVLAHWDVFSLNTFFSLVLSLLDFSFQHSYRYLDSQLRDECMLEG